MLRPTNRSFRISKTAKTTDKVALYGKNAGDQRLVSLYRLSQTLTAADPSGVMPSVFKGEFTTLEDARAAMENVGDYAIVYCPIYKSGFIEMKTRNGQFSVVETFSDDEFTIMNKIVYLRTGKDRTSQNNQALVLERSYSEYEPEFYYETATLGSLENASPVILRSATNGFGTELVGHVYIKTLSGSHVFTPSPDDGPLRLHESESVYSLETIEDTPKAVYYDSTSNSFNTQDTGERFMFFISTMPPLDYFNWIDTLS